MASKKTVIFSSLGVGIIVLVLTLAIIYGFVEPRIARELPIAKEAGFNGSTMVQQVADRLHNFFQSSNLNLTDVEIPSPKTSNSHPILQQL